MAPDAENPRAVNAIRLLSTQKDFTLDKMIATGYNTYLSAFDILLPSLFIAYDAVNEKTTDSLKDAIALLRGWDRTSSASSVATTLAIEWAAKLNKKIRVPVMDDEERRGLNRLRLLVKNISASEKIKLLKEVLNDLTKAFGTWQVAWGTVNRYQRINDDLQQKFDDNKQSFPVGLASSEWGCLPSFSGSKPLNSKYRYGVNGNSFVAAVEFGKTIKAKTIITGGEGTDPSSKHFLDQAQMYIDGKFKDVLFYKKDVLKHAERQYHPGD